VTGKAGKTHKAFDQRSGGFCVSGLFFVFKTNRIQISGEIIGEICTEAI